jgi:hypothetical protein
VTGHGGGASSKAKVPVECVSGLSVCVFVLEVEMARCVCVFVLEVEMARVALYVFVLEVEMARSRAAGATNSCEWETCGATCYVQDKPILDDAHECVYIAGYTL